jgi:hypothetical protein
VRAHRWHNSPTRPPDCDEADRKGSDRTESGASGGGGVEVDLELQLSESSSLPQEPGSPRAELRGGPVSMAGFQFRPSRQIADRLAVRMAPGMEITSGSHRGGADGQWLDFSGSNKSHWPLH